MAELHVARSAPISAIVPTRERAPVLQKMLASLGEQSVLPAELIVVDASSGDDSRRVVEQFGAAVAARGCRALWQAAAVAGAAAQRNQAMALASQPLIGFFDDDITFEPDCIERLWRALERDPGLGGVSAMIVNQRYQPPGAISRAMFRLMAGAPAASYAGRVLGPAVNLLPEDDERLPEVVPVEWLNLGATLYRREVLPAPPFDAFFTGYSLGEDLVLSLKVVARARLANVRNARIFHDSQPGAYKSDAAALSRMRLANRHYVMTQILHRRRAADYAKLALWEAFQLASAAVAHRGGRRFWQTLAGTGRGAADILRGKRGKGA